MVFNPSRKEASDFNGGERYRNRVDSPSADDFNNLIEGLLKGQEDIEKNSAYIEKNSVAIEVIPILEKRVENLYERTFPEIDVIDDSVAYQKIVPIGALPYAEVAKVGGMSYKSENLIPTNRLTTLQNRGVTFTVENGVITASGMASGHFAANYDFPEFSLPKGTYTLSGGPRGSSGETYQFWCSVGNQYIYAIEDEGRTFTIEQTETVRLYFYCYENVSVNGLVVRPMLNRGSTAKPYSPYFEGLRHAKVTAIKSIGANMLDFDTWAKNTDVNGGVKVVGDNEITITATNSDDCYTSHHTGIESNKIYTKPNTKYSLCWDYSGTVDGLVYVFCNGGFTTLFNALMNAKHLTFTTPEDCTFITFRLGVMGIGNSMTYRNIGFYEGEARKFAPYVGTLATLSIPPAVQALPDYGLGVSATGNNHVDWSERKYHHPCIGVVLDGSADEGWGVASDGLGGYYLALSENGAGSNVRSNRYEPAPHPWAELGTIGVTAQGVLWVTTEKTSIEEWRSSLKSNPLEIVYELATPDEPTDISHLLTEDNFIRVEGGGTITAVNEYGLAAPTFINYQVD